MFGIDFSELIVCLLVALFVIGPQRLPETVRTLGLWIGRFKRSLRETRETIEQQLGVEEIRRQLHSEEMMRTLDNMQEEIETALNYERRGSKPALEPAALLPEPVYLPTETQLSAEAQVFVDAQLLRNDPPAVKTGERAALAYEGDTTYGEDIKIAQSAENHLAPPLLQNTSESQLVTEPSIDRRSLG